MATHHQCPFPQHHWRNPRRLWLLGPTPWWCSGAVRGTCHTCVCVNQAPDYNERWLLRQDGAFPIHLEALGVWQIHQGRHHEESLHLEFAERPTTSRKTRATTPLERAPSTVPLSLQTKCLVVSDHSPSSWSGDQSLPVRVRRYVKMKTSSLGSHPFYFSM